MSDFVIFLGAMRTLVVDFDDVDMTLDGMRAIAIAVRNVSLKRFFYKSFCYMSYEKFSFESTRLCCVSFY